MHGPSCKKNVPFMFPVQLTERMLKDVKSKYSYQDHNKRNNKCIEEVVGFIDAF
jgi:hypothetical protein